MSLPSCSSFGVFADELLGKERASRMRVPSLNTFFPHEKKNSMNQFFFDCRNKRKHHDDSRSSSTSPYLQPSSNISSMSHNDHSHQQNQTFDLQPVVSTSNIRSNSNISTSTQMMIERNLKTQNYLLHLLRSENVDISGADKDHAGATTSSYSNVHKMRRMNSDKGSKLFTSSLSPLPNVTAVNTDTGKFCTDKKEQMNIISSSSSLVSLKKCLSFLLEASNPSLKDLVSSSMTTRTPSQRHSYYQTEPRRTSFTFQNTISGHPGVNEEFDLLPIPRDADNENAKQPGVMMKKKNFLLEMILSPPGNNKNTNDNTISSSLSPSSPQQKSSKSSSNLLTRHGDESLLPPVEEPPTIKCNNKKRKRMTHSNNSSSDSLDSINPLDPSSPCFSIDFAVEYEQRLLGLLDLMKKTETSRIQVALIKKKQDAH